MALAPSPVFAVEELPSPYVYPEPAWSPYLVGALIGLLVLVTLTLLRKKIGASSAYADAVGLTIRGVAGERVRRFPFWRNDLPKVGWTLMVVVGAIIGSAIAAWSGGELTGEFLQPLWIERFGEGSGLLRTIFALVGGLLMAFGARLAGGCTSGHGISGTMQLAAGSWAAVLCFFASGVATALLLYRL